MKPPLFLALLLLLSRLTSAAPAPYFDLMAATAGGQASIAAQASGLGPNNLTCTITNLTGQELRLRVPPGLHFAASDAGAQDLFTYQQQLLVLAAKSRQQLRLQGFCMEHHDYAPRANLVYTCRGLAGRGLQPLGDSLQKYPGLADGYGQMFVWAITDRQPMLTLRVVAELKTGAANVMRYVTSVTGQKPVELFVARDARPSVKTFSKRAFVLYHSPTAQVASLKVFGSNGLLVSELFTNRKLSPGVVHYTYGINAIVGVREAPVFFVRLLSPEGKVLKEVKIDDNSSETDPVPAALKFDFAFTLAKPVKNAYFRVRLRDGTLVEDLAKEAYLPAGGFKFQMGFHHLYPAGTPFVARLETETGTLICEQPIAAP